MNANLNRRLDALEEIAEAMRLRPFRELVKERGVPFERLMELYEEGRARAAALRARGLTDEQIEEAIAREMGLGVDELRARRDELRSRFG